MVAHALRPPPITLLPNRQRESHIVQDFNMAEISAQDLVDTLREGLLVLAADLTVVSANRSFLRMFKTHKSQTIGRKLYDLGNGQWDIASLRHLLGEVIPKENSVEAYEVDHVFPDLGRKVMLLNARKIFRPGDQVEFFLLAIEDVTIARLAQHEAELHWNLAQNVVDTIRDPLVILEVDMTVVSASRAFLDLFGATNINVLGRKLSELGQGQWDVSALQKLLDRVVPNEEPMDDFLLEDDFPDLGRRVFKVNARKVFRPGDHVARLLVAFEDATAEVLLDRHRDVLAAELAHRIKNSLQIISAFVSFEIRRADAPCIPGYQAMQARISAVAELYDVIARSSAFGPVSVPAYLEGISSSVRASLLGQADDIVLKVEAEELSILPDHAVPLGLIANELATNAIKYAFQNGKGEVILGFQRRDGEVALTVSDNGAGMTKGTGTGLGTRFVEAFVRQLGGSMATGTSPAGTTFTVRLPATVLAGEPS